MLTQLEVFSPRISTSPMPFDGAGFAETDPIQIRGIEGLGPVNSEISTRKYASIDGEAFSTATLGKRNIVITIGLNPNWVDQTFESLRQILYAYFMPKSKVRLRFTSTHLPVVETIGWVEGFNPNIFSKEPEYQVSVICPQTHFEAINPTVVTGLTVATGVQTLTDVTYEGQLETGFEIVFDKGSASADQAGQLQLVTVSPLQEAFVSNFIYAATSYHSEISTVQGKKHSTLKYHDGSPDQNRMRHVLPNTNWWTLKPGLNRVRANLDTGGATWTITYRARYGGL